MKSSVRENLKKMKETYMACSHSELNTSMKQYMFLFGTRLGLLTMSLTGTRRVKETIQKRLHTDNIDRDNETKTPEA